MSSGPGEKEPGRPFLFTRNIVLLEFQKAKHTATESPGMYKPCKSWDKLPIKWLAGFQPSTVLLRYFTGHMLLSMYLDGL